MKNNDVPDFVKFTHWRKIGGIYVSLYNIRVNTIDGEEITLKKFEGKVLLIVNTASKCGLTPQYSELEKLYQKFGEDKFEILGFPCNQFGNQEPGGSDEIQKFCQINYGVTFPMFEKIDVKGSNIHPLFKHLVEQKKGLLNDEIKWNFTKFLVDAKGNVVSRFAPTTKPTKLEKKIVDLINQS